MFLSYPTSVACEASRCVEPRPGLLSTYTPTVSFDDGWPDTVRVRRSCATRGHHPHKRHQTRAFAQPSNADTLIGDRNDDLTPSTCPLTRMVPPFGNT
jgi:hypothetical protein